MVARAGRRGRRGWRRSGLCRRGDVLFVADVPSAPDEAAVLRAANARLREVVEAKDTEIAALRAVVEAGPPAECRSCGAGLAGARAEDDGWAQEWDIPPVRLAK